MKQLEPDWVEVFNKSQIQRELGFAAHNCDHEFMARDIKEWTEDITTAKCDCKSLCDRIYEVWPATRWLRVTISHSFTLWHKNMASQLYLWKNHDCVGIYD